ncbi:MAG: hypothetical protein INQ03_14380 [Candidatus Heimdallarchaeota archaeon]|nr:hypothetical protein [Candidatus Heimdallarchaeota archaeon]
MVNILDQIPTGAKIASVFFLVLIMLVAIIKSRYKKYTNRDFVLAFRNGKIRSEGYGGGYFVLPFIDELIVLSTTVQNLEVDAGEVITKENQDVRVNGFVVWRIESPREAYSSITGAGNVMLEINKVLSRLVESIVRTTVARLSLDQVLRERGLIIDAIMSELVSVVGPMGIKINTAEIRHVEVVDQQLFNDLQEKYRQQARLEAQRVMIETNQEIMKKEAFSEQAVKLYRAEQEELASVRDLEKDRKILLEQQKLNETEQIRLRKVQELEKEREASVAEINQKTLKIEAETRLIEIELEAEAKKRQIVLEQVDVQAAQKQRMAEADAEARKKAADAEAQALLRKANADAEARERMAKAEAEARKRMAEADAEAVKMRANAEKEAIELQAEAESFRLSQIADAKKKSLLAEAEGRKAILLAEAEGLREKVQAEGYVNEAMILRELVQQLPEIAKSMKVGDINWLNMGGSNGNGDSPLGIIPKNLLQLMTLSKSFGLDLEGLLNKVRGRTSNGNPQMLEQLAHLALPDFEKLQNAEPIFDDDGMIIGLDYDADNDIDFHIPEDMRSTDLNEVIENYMRKLK